MKVLYFTRDYTPHDFRFLKAILENGNDVWYLRLETRNVYESRPLPDGVHVVDWKFGKEPFDLRESEDNAILALKEIFDHRAHCCRLGILALRSSRSLNRSA